MMNTSQNLNDVAKVKLIIVGDSGVGKSSFVHLASFNEPLLKSSWTIGCGVEVMLHKYKEGTPSQNSYYVELWDVGGNNSHKNARHVFYKGVHGVVLVHDLTNRKSLLNLNNWLSEVILKGVDNDLGLSVQKFYGEQFGGVSQIPIFVVATKLDQFRERSSSSQLKPSIIASRYGADEVFLNCIDARSLAPGSSNAVKFSRFCDKVISRRIDMEKRETNFTYTEKENPTVRRAKSSAIINIPNL